MESVDGHGFGSNRGTVDLIHCEAAMDELGYQEQEMLWSSSQVKRSTEELHGLGDDLCPVENVTSCKLGECYQFDYEKTIQQILTAFGLASVAERESVELSITLDGS